MNIRLFVAFALARASLLAFMALAFVLGPPAFDLALYGRNWPARAVLVGLLAGVWCSFFAVAAVRARARRTR